jgi:hypothetical protein
MRIAASGRRWPALICAVLAVMQAGCRANRGGVIELERASFSPSSMPHWELFRLPGDATFDRVRITGDGKRGWLAGRAGSLYELTDGRWVQQANMPLSGTVALTQDGESGWGVGRQGAVLRYRGHQWTTDQTASSITTSGLNDICLSADGKSGWAVGDQGTMLKYSGSTWSRVPEAATLLGAGGLSHIWCSQDATAAWAAAASAQKPWMIRLRNGAWQADSVIQPQALWVVSSTWAWASSTSLILRFDGRWSLNHVLDPSDPEGPILSFWSNPDDSRAWAAGDRGRMMRRQIGTWYKDDQFKALTTAGIHSIWLTREETDGWAVGEHGTVVRYRPIPLAARLEPIGDASIEKLTGDFNLVLSAPGLSFPYAELLSADGTAQFLTPKEFRPRYSSADHHVVRVTFAAAAERVELLKGTQQSLIIVEGFEHPSIPTWASFTSPKFIMVGLSTWRKTLYAALGVVVLNLLLFLGATRIRWLRTVVLSPVGSAVFGLVLGKYLLTDWMIRFVRPLKLAMFRDYRRQLAAHENIAKWLAKPDPYVPPAIELPKAGPPAAADSDEAWKQTFETLIASPRRCLWLIQGPSGLGKTALLEKWAGLALSQGRTPLLIRLRRGPAAQEAVALMSELGDIDLKDEVAVDLLNGGGFVLLLDGLNEDRSPDATREFVRRAARRNLVVLTSQFDPGWQEVVHVERIELREFGAAQLRKLLDEHWAAEILAARHLANVARLPITAKLLAEFVTRTDRLPADRLQIYGGLVTELEPGKLLNLEEKAWLLFKSNEFDFAPDGGLPKDFCDAAVAHGALTRRQGDRYGFAHDLVQRFLVAVYLDSCERRPLADWHHEMKAGLKRGTWIEVLDFWGETWGRRAVADPRQLTGYEEFLRESGGFSREIFATRLYPHYDSLCASGAVTANAELIAWAARLLAGAVREAG